MEIFGFIGTWFGYVGSCVVSPDATCRPFLAFIALGAAAAAALTLVLMSYRRSLVSELAEVEESRSRARGVEISERVRRAIADKAAARPSMHTRYRAAA
jgi:hypothetical protein